MWLTSTWLGHFALTISVSFSASSSEMCIRDSAETNTINMMAAADKVSTGLITYAARDSAFDGKRIRKGEIMALENGKIVATSTDPVSYTHLMCIRDRPRAPLLGELARSA